MAYSKIILNGDTLMDVTGDTVDAGKLLYGETATKNSGAKVTGNIASKSSSDLTASGAIVSVPSGYYASNVSKSIADGSLGPYTSNNNTKTSSHFYATKTYPAFSAGYFSSMPDQTITLALETKSCTPSQSEQVITPSNTNCYLNSVTVSAMPTGSAGTPTATKGTVSNHSITVTPSVTNTTGYITGSTKTGTAVTVSASELASGNKSITENGTDIDVVGYSTVSVAVSGGGGSSNLVTGSFTTGTTRDSRDGSFTINYSGSGFPVALIVCADNGTSTGVPAWTASVSNYDIGYFAIYKRTGSEPSYTTGSDAENLGIVTYCYRYNASTVSVDGQINAASYIGSAYTPSYKVNAVKFVGSGTNVGYYVGNGTSTTLGLSPSTTYSYIAIYSE